MKTTKPGQEIIAETHKAGKEARKQKFAHSAPVLIVKGFFNFTEGLALLITALFSIHQGYYGTYPKWGAYTLMIAGAAVLIPAAILLSRFFRKVGNE